MVIESQGVRIATREDVTWPVVTLISGTPYYVTPAELASYFNPNNLIFSGISQEQYTSTGKLPEGFYTFCFETVEPATGLTVSNKGCAFAWITISDPPFLNIPAKAETVTPNASQNINFQWTPRHNASPTAGYNTDYVFSITEVMANDFSPESAFTSHQALYTDSTAATMYNYGPAKPLLIAGRRYAWRVQAKAKQGLDNLAMFRNNGYSEVFWFDYKNNCTSPTNINAQVQGSRVTITWQPLPIYLSYKVQYREANNASAEWFTISTLEPTVVLNDLNFNKTYEYRVGASCEEESFNYSNLLSFTTGAAAVPIVANCGDSSAIPNTVPQTYLASMAVGDTIKARDFNVKILTISGSESFTGTGTVKIPWLLGVKAQVKFTNIKVNMAKQLAIGTIETTYDPKEAGILNMNDLIDIFCAGCNVGNVITGQAGADTTVGFPIQWPGGITAVAGPGYNPPTVNGPATITVTGVGGTPVITIVAQALPKTIMDSTGNIYQVNNTNPITVSLLAQGGGKTMLSKTNKGLIDADKAIVKFVNYNDPKVIFAFDEWNTLYKKSGTFSKEYEKISCAGGGDCIDGGAYYVSAKAIAPGKTDYLKATVTLTDNSINPDSIQFVNGKGLIYTKKRVDSAAGVFRYEIAVVGGPEKDAQEIYALYPKLNSKTFNLGKVLVACYPEKVYEVRLVRVNTNKFINLDKIKDSLKKVFGGINIKFNISFDSAFNDNTWDLNKDGLNISGSGIFSSYTSEMSALNNAFKANRSTNSSTFYIFLLPKSSNNGALGDAPRGLQFGYVFVDENPELELTIAHEIGHGMFKLKHVFDGMGYSQGESENNLMDYPNGSKISKVQWDLIHDPGLVIRMFDSDASNMSTSFTGLKSFYELRNKNSATGSDFSKYTYTFITPAGKLITLPGSTKSVSFSTLDRTFYTGNGLPSDDLQALGSLISFINEKEIKYSAYYTGAKFDGYLKEKTTTDFYKEKLSKVISPNSGIGVFIAVENNKFISYATKFPSPSNTAVYPDDNNGSGTSLTDFAIFPIPKEQLNKTIKNLLMLKKINATDNQILTLDNGVIYFTNETIEFENASNSTTPTLNPTKQTLKEFLLTILNDKSTLKEYVEYITLINLKKSALEGFRDCLNKVNFDEMIAELRKGWSCSTCVTNPNFNKVGYNGFKSKSATQLVALAQSANILWMKLDSCRVNNLSAKIIHTVINQNFKPCAFRSLSYETRMYVLNKFLGDGFNNDHWYRDPTWVPFMSDGSFILKYLIELTPDDQKALILKNGFRGNGNYLWLRNLWLEAQTKPNGVAYEDVRDIIDILGTWVVKYNSQLGVTPTWKDIVDPAFGIATGTKYPVGADVYYIGMKSSDEKDINYGVYDTRVTQRVGNEMKGFNTNKGEIVFLPSGRIRFKQAFTYYSSYPQICNNPDPTGLCAFRERVFMEYDNDLDPFEVMTCMSLGNYAELGVEAGDQNIMPVFSTMFLDNDVKRTDYNRKFRQIINGAAVIVAVVSAPATGGTSLAAIAAISNVAFGIVAGIDSKIQYDKNNLTPSEFETNKPFYQGWDKVYTAAGYVNLGGNGLALAEQGFNLFRKITTTIKTYNSIKETMATMPSNVEKIALLRQTWAKLSGVNANSIFTPPANFSNSESTIFGGVNDFVKGDIDGLINGALSKGNANDFKNADFSVAIENPISPSKDYVSNSTTPRFPTNVGNGSATEMGLIIETEAATIAVPELVAESVFEKIGNTFSVRGSYNKIVTTSPETNTFVMQIEKYKIKGKPITDIDVIVAVSPLPNSAPRILWASNAAAKIILEKQKKRQQCKTCVDHGQPICDKFTLLVNRAGTVNKYLVDNICKNVLTPNADAVATKLLILPAYSEFIKDLMPTNNDKNYIANAIKGSFPNRLNYNKIVAWEKLYEKKSRNYAKDIMAISELANILAKPTVITTLGGNTGIDLILEKNVRLGCNTCDPSNAPYLQPMHKFLEDVLYFAENHGTNGASLIADLKSTPNYLIGAAFQLRVINDDRYQARFNGARFDLSIADAGEENEIQNEENAGLCRYDISTGSNANLNLYEFKSWSPSTKTFFLASSTFRAKFANQLKAYFRNDNISTLSRLHYYFDGRTGRLGIKDAKEIIQKVLQENAASWYADNTQLIGGGTLATKLNLLFEVGTVSQFLDKINDLNIPVYNFVETK